MKKLLFSALLGFSLILLAGCSEGKKTETEKATASEMKCEAGKCGDDMEKVVVPASKCGKGKCGDE